MLCSVVYAKAKVEVLWTGHATVMFHSMEGKVIVVDTFIENNAKTSNSLKIFKPVTQAAESVEYLVELENGKKIYHSGHAGVIGYKALIGKLYKSVVALISIGGK